MTKKAHKELYTLVVKSLKNSPCELHLRGVRLVDEKLYINFESMSAKEFFDANKESFLKLMRQFYADDLTKFKSLGLVFRKVVAEWNLHVPKDEARQLLKQDDKANGEFINNLRGKNGELFEDIRALIKKRKEL